MRCARAWAAKLAAEAGSVSCTSTEPMAQPSATNMSRMLRAMTPAPMKLIEPALRWPALSQRAPSTALAAVRTALINEPSSSANG